MSIAVIADLLAEGEKLLAALRDETRAFAVADTSFDEEPAEAFTTRREHLLAELERIDAAIIDRLASCKTSGNFDIVDRYREQRDSTYNEVLALDKEIVAKAQEKLRVLTDDFASLAHGKKALNGYRPAAAKLPGYLDREA